MDAPTRTFLAAALALDKAASELEQEIQTSLAHQSKHNSATKRILDLIKTQEKLLPPNLKSTIASLNGKRAIHFRGIEKQSNRLSKAIARYQQMQSAFTCVADHFSDRVSQVSTSFRNRALRDNAQYRIIERLIKSAIEKELHPDAVRFENPTGSHAYIPIDIPRFLDLLIELDALLSIDPDHAAPTDKYKPVRFLEVGCGQGRNIIVARNSNLVSVRDFSGFDINVPLVTAGQKGLGLDDTIFVDDALTHDYGDYDIVFSYRPFADDDLQRNLERRMAHTMKMGAYLLGPNAHDPGANPEFTQMNDAGEIWKKTTDRPIG